MKNDHPQNMLKFQHQAARLHTKPAGSWQNHNFRCQKCLRQKSMMAVFMTTVYWVFIKMNEKR